VNLKIQKNIPHTKEEKDFFKKKIKITKKTELCKNWVLYNDCFYKDNCSFAHGDTELRVKYAGFNFKSKTKICKSFAEKMHCPFGNRCQYRHVFSYNRLISFDYMLKTYSDNIIFCLKKYERDNNNFEIRKILDSIKMNCKFDMYIYY
jgi:hypothetical protein